MPLISMTGYGRGQASANGTKVEIELSSVNRKQLDIKIGLPRQLNALESRIHEEVHRAVRRGAVTGSINISRAGAMRGAAVDGELAAKLVAELRRVARRLKLKGDLSVDSLLSIPNLVSYSEHSEDVAFMWRLVKKAMCAALVDLVRMRKREGARLEVDLAERTGNLKGKLKLIKSRAPSVMKRYRNSLMQRLGKAGLKTSLADPLLLREVAFFMDRSDISEEIVRLESHFSQMDKQLAAREPVGRPLDFICQEMFREINTIGAKANDSVISRCVIQFKAQLEAIREQVQNVE